MTKKSARTHAYLALLGNSLIWGICLPLVKKGLDQTTPMTFLFFRYLFACITSLPFIIIFWKKVKIKLKDLPVLIGVGLLSTVVAHFLLYQGLNKTQAIESSMLTSIIPIFVILGGSIFLKEKVTRIEKIGASLAFLGSIIIIIEPIIKNGGKMSFQGSLGNILILSYNLIWAVAVLWMKKLSKKYHAFTIAYSSFFVSLVGFSFLAAWENPGFFSLDFFNLNYALAATLYMGTLGSVVALFLYQYGQSKIEASEATLFTYLTTLFAIPLSIIWLKEQVSEYFIVGAVVIALGIFVAEKRWKRKL